MSAVIGLVGFGVVIHLGLIMFELASIRRAVTRVAVALEARR